MSAATWGPNVKWGAPISNGGPGTTAPPLATTLCGSKQVNFVISAKENSKQRERSFLRTWAELGGCGILPDATNFFA